MNLLYQLPKYYQFQVIKQKFFGNEFSLLQGLINDLEGERQIDVHTYLNMETLIMDHENIQSDEYELSSVSSVEDDNIRMQ